MHKRFDRFFALAAAGCAALALTANTVEAKTYTRSCQATYNVVARTPTGGSLTGGNFTFTGKGKVGYYAPNKARERALGNIKECVNAAWSRRLITSVPSACTDSNLIYSYPFTSLHFGLMQTVCLANPGHDRIMVDLVVTYSGDTGCVPAHNNWREVITQSYTINCPDYQAGPSH
jgi:hypothetical protein